MFTLFIVLHVIFCVFLILVILLQTGKGAGIGAAFGGGSQTVFGPRGAGSFIGRLTGIVAGLFMFTSMVLAYQSTSTSGTVANRVTSLKTEEAKAVEEVDLSETSETKDTTKDTQPSKKADVAKDAGSEKTAVDDKVSVEPESVDKGADKDKPAEKNTPPGLDDSSKDDKPAGLEKAEKATVEKKVAPKATKKAEVQKEKDTPKAKATVEKAAVKKEENDKATSKATVKESSKAKAEKPKAEAIKPKAAKADEGSVAE